MKKHRKRKLLELYANNLSCYFPELSNIFMCPTCLTKIPTDQANLISEAHIIPEAAGGKLKTLICRKCNSEFGSKQDKWFGELVRILQTEKQSIFHTKFKDRHFGIDGRKVNGSWDINGNGDIEVFVYMNRNSPETNSIIDAKLGSSPPNISLSLPLPILPNAHLVKVGYLTAGYLMMFLWLGYSWVLQRHLDQIRAQIMNPDANIISANYLASHNKPANRPWVGFMPINGIVALAFGVGSQIVFMPPYNNKTLYCSLGNFKFNLNMSEVRTIDLPAKPHHIEPSGVTFENKVMVIPDMSTRKLDSLPFIHFSKQQRQAQMLRPVSADKAKALSEMSNVVRQKMNIQQ